MRKINIFLASSLKECETERMLIENFIRKVSDGFEDAYNIKLQPLLCENFDDAYTVMRKQEEYNRKIRESDFCFFIFFKKAGEYTREEFSVAREQFEKSKKPKIYTYFKEIEEGEAEESLISFMQELDKTFTHYYGTFSHIDTVKLRILLSIKLQEMDFLEVKIKGDDFTVDGKAVLDIRNVSEFANNESLKEMQSELEILEEEYLNLKVKYDKGLCTPEEYRRFGAVSAKRETLKGEIEELRGNIFNMSLRMVKDNAHGEITLRQKKAYALFEKGDYEGCLSVLDSKDIDSDFERQRENYIAACKTYIREHKTAIDILYTMTKYEGRFDEIEERFKKIVPRILETRVEIKTAFAYLSFLKMRRKDEETLELAKKMLTLCEEEKSDYVYSALGTIGFAYIRMHKYEDAEEYMVKSFEARKSLAEENFEEYVLDLMAGYNNLAALYKKMGKDEKAEPLFKECIEICRPLLTKYPRATTKNFVGTNINLCNLYISAGNTKKAEEVYLEAKAAIEKLPSDALEMHRGEAAGLCCCGAWLYSTKGDFEAAEPLYGEAISKYEQLSSENPIHFMPALAQLYEDMADFCHVYEKYEKAAQFYVKLVEAYEKLARLMPDKYEDKLLECYDKVCEQFEEAGQTNKMRDLYVKRIETLAKLATENPGKYLGMLVDKSRETAKFYLNQQKKERAKNFYSRAVEICETAAERDKKHLSHLAESLGNIGYFYMQTGDRKETEKLYGRVLSICEELEGEEKEVSLGRIYGRMASFCSVTGSGKDAEGYYKKAVKIFEGLKKKNPDKYIPDLAITYFNYGMMKMSITTILKGYMLAKKMPSHPICRNLLSSMEALGLRG